MKKTQRHEKLSVIHPPRRPDCRRRDDRLAVECESSAEFFLGESIDQDCLFDRRQTAAADSLQHAEEDQHRQTRCDAAEKRSRGE
jgi:hypothetical protein